MLIFVLSVHSVASWNRAGIEKGSSQPPRLGPYTAALSVHEAHSSVRGKSGYLNKVVESGTALQRPNGCWENVSSKLQQLRNATLCPLTPRHSNQPQPAPHRELARSMPERCQAVIDAKGDHTKF